jgi:N-acetylglutamate synthase-like GNAT family acetyltransferase
MGIIKNTRTKYIRLKFYVKEKNLAVCDYAIFPTENIGYISNVKVHSDIQNNKIGTKIRQYAIDQLEPTTNSIYSYPTNNHIKYICKKQGFEPIESNSNWYVKKFS